MLPFLLVWVEVRGGVFSDAGEGGGRSMGIFTPDGFKIETMVKNQSCVFTECLAQVGAELVWCPGAEGLCRDHLVWP